MKLHHNGGTEHADDQCAQTDKTDFITSLEDLAEAEIDRDPSLLSRDRGKAATLMQGAVDRSNIYKTVETSLDRLLAEHVGHVEATIREIRRMEIGEDAAAEEQKRGSKPDEEYAAEAEVRRRAREEQRKKDEARKRREEEKEKLRAEEAKKKAELDRLRRREERRKEEEAKEAKRKQDREANRALLRKVEEEEERKRQERRERREREDHERSAPRDLTHERLRSEHREIKSESEPPKEDIPMPAAASPETPAAPPIDEQDLEAIALDCLLNEGREAAAKNDAKPDFRRLGPLEDPSLRKSLSGKGFGVGAPSPPKGPASDRLHSPHKMIDPPKGPRLSYSQTKKSAYPPHGGETQYRESSLSRGLSYHTSSRRDSTSHSYKDYEPEAKAAWAKQVATRGGDEREYYKSSARRERSPTHERTDGYRHRDYYGEDKHTRERSREYYDERDDRYKERDPEREYRSSRHDRSRSRDKEDYHESHSHRDRDRDRLHDRDRDIDYKARSSHYEETHRSSRYDRSRSPTIPSSHHGTYDKPPYSDPRAEKPRAKSPVEIDRYVPSTSSRARHGGDATEEREKERPNTRDGYRDKEEYGNRREYREKDDYKDRKDYRDRRDDKDYDGYRDKRDYREKDDYRGRDRERDRDKYAERDLREKEDHRGRERDRDRDKYAERDLREKKGYIEIDRYVPESSSRAKELEYPRTRDGGRDRERDRERERPRERDREKGS